MSKFEASTNNVEIGVPILDYLAQLKNNTRMNFIDRDTGEVISIGPVLFDEGVFTVTEEKE